MTSEPTASEATSVTSIPTLPPLAELPPTPTPAPTPTPTPESTFHAPSLIDSDLAISREYLEALGLVPIEAGADTFYQVAQQYYDGTVLFRNDWGLPEGASGHISYVRDSRYTFASSAVAEEFLQTINHGLILEMESHGMHSEELSLSVGDTSYATSFTREGERAYAAQFLTGQTAGIVIIGGDETLTQEQAFDILSLAAQTVTFTHPVTATSIVAEGGWGRSQGVRARFSAPDPGQEAASPANPCSIGMKM